MSHQLSLHRRTTGLHMRISPGPPTYPIPKRNIQTSRQKENRVPAQPRLLTCCHDTKVTPCQLLRCSVISRVRVTSCIIVRQKNSLRGLVWAGLWKTWSASSLISKGRASCFDSFKTTTYIKMADR
jgi:hypothetical protein